MNRGFFNVMGERGLMFLDWKIPKMNLTIAQNVIYSCVLLLIRDLVFS